MSHGPPGRQLHGLLIVPRGRAVVSFVLQGEAQPAMSRRRIRALPDGLLEERFSGRVLALGRQHVSQGKLRFDRTRIEPRRFRKMRRCACQIALQLQRDCQIVVRHPLSAGQRDCPTIALGGRRQIAPRLIQRAEVAMSLRIIGLQGNGAVVTLDGLRDLTQIAMGLAQRRVKLGARPVAVNGLLYLRCCPAKIAVRQRDQTQGVQRGGMPRLDCQQSAQRLGGLLPLTGPLQADGRVE